MNAPATRERPKWWQVVVVVPLLIAVAPALIALALFALLAFAIASACTHVVVWTWWCLRGRDILLVYSDSPIWRDYFEQNILPHLGDRAIVLNWSQRKHWRVSVAWLAFKHFGSYRQFNPLAVVFRPFRRTRTFRFWKPFKDFKHGRPWALQKMERDFFALIGVQRPSGPG